MGLFNLIAHRSRVDFSTLCCGNLTTSIKMIIYKCLISGDELFTDAFKIERDGHFYKLTGKMTTRTDKVDDSVIGGNASQEEAVEANADSSQSGIDIVLNQRLVETGFGSKKEYQAYFKDFLKKLEPALKEKFPDKDMEQWKKNMTEAFKWVVSEFKEWQFYTGESMVDGGSICLCKWVGEPEVPEFYIYADSVIEEKC